VNGMVRADTGAKFTPLAALRVDYDASSGRHFYPFRQWVRCKHMTNGAVWRVLDVTSIRGRNIMFVTISLAFAATSTRTQFRAPNAQKARQLEDSRLIWQAYDPLRTCGS
jgi:hypothetical protein